MQPMPKESHINLADLKFQIEKKLGPEKSHSYFSYLVRFLNNKLKKSAFDKICTVLLGRENIHLHNQLLISVIKNACLSKEPPPLPPDRDTSQHTGRAGNKPLVDVEGIHFSKPTVSTPVVWSNGDIPPSPRRCRSGVRERKLKDRPSPLGPNGRIDAIASHSLLPSGSLARENGSLTPCDLRRPVQHQTDVAEPLSKRPRLDKQLQHDQFPVHSRRSICVVEAKDAELEFMEGANSSLLPLRAPLGIPFCPASIGGARRTLPLGISASSCSFLRSCDSGELCHTEDLKTRMDQIAEAHGLGGVTIDCANLLNKGLDAYLKRLIKSCVELTGARSEQEDTKLPAHKLQPQGKIINGMWSRNHMHMNTGKGSSGELQYPKTNGRISLADLKVAMELNPQQLGEDWSLLLEKICLSSFEE